MRYQGEALILGRRRVGEADKLVWLYTPKQGVVKAVAKGVRKITSRRGGHLEPATRVAVMMHQGRYGHFLTKVETLNHYPNLHADIKILARAERLGQLIIYLFGEGQPERDLYISLQKVWEVMPRLSTHKQVLLEIIMTLAILKRAGFIPDVRHHQQLALLTYHPHRAWQTSFSYEEINNLFTVMHRYAADIISPRFVAYA